MFIVSSSTRTRSGVEGQAETDQVNRSAPGYDEIELAFDAAHDLVSGGPDDHRFTVNADGRLTDGGAPIPPGTIAVSVRPVTGGWDVEARLPIHALQSEPLFAGRRLGFTLGLHDDDDDDANAHIYSHGYANGYGDAGQLAHPNGDRHGVACEQILLRSAHPA